MTSAVTAPLIRTALPARKYSEPGTSAHRNSESAFTGLRWGEAVGLCRDAVDLDGRIVRVIRTVTEVAGQTEFKAFPKSRAGRRAVPLPDWLVDDLRKYMELYPPDGPQGLIFTNAVGGALRRTLFRSRVWRPALVRAGLLGQCVRSTANSRQCGRTSWVVPWSKTSVESLRLFSTSRGINTEG